MENRWVGGVGVGVGALGSKGNQRTGPEESSKAREFWEDTQEQREALMEPGHVNSRDRKSPGAAGQELHPKGRV